MMRRSGDPASGIPVLQKALKLKPQHFVARMHLAGNYEWIGAVEEARQQYCQLLDDRQTLSRGMQKLVISCGAMPSGMKKRLPAE